MPTALQQIEQRRFLTEWHLPVSTRLSIRDLTLLASSCKSVGCHMVVFSYRAAVGRPIPEIPKQSDLQLIAKNAGLVKILTRLDIEDIGELSISKKAQENMNSDQLAEKNAAIVKGIQKFLSQATIHFDIFSILLKQDPFLFETLNVKEIFTPFLTKCPLIINIDDCPTTQIILPRTRVPEGSVIEFSQCNLIDSRNFFNTNGLSNLRQQLAYFKRYHILVSCGGEQIYPNDVEDAVISKIRSQLDSACMMESLCGRSDFLMTNKRMSLKFVLRMKAIEAKKAQRKLKEKTCAGQKLKLRAQRKRLLSSLQKDGKMIKKSQMKKGKKEDAAAKNSKNNKKTSGETAKNKKSMKKKLVTVCTTDKNDSSKDNKVVPLNSNLLSQILRSQLVSQHQINRRTAAKEKLRKKKAKAMRVNLKRLETKKKNKSNKKEKMNDDSSKKSEGQKNQNSKSSTVVNPNENNKPVASGGDQIVVEENFGWSEDI